jgi:large repetitive protein
VNFALERALSVTVAGTVSEQGGGPLAGITVTLVQNRTSNRTLVATDSTGRYRLSMDPGPEPSDYTLVVAPPGFAEIKLVLAIPNGGTVEEDVVLARLGTLTGLVTDGSSAPAGPVAGATVHAGGVAATSDAAGRYQMALAPGSTVVTVEAGGFEHEVVTITVTPGDVTNQDFVLVKASAALTGTVFDGDSGDPIFDAFVVVAGAPSGVRTDSVGSYSVSGIPAGSARVTVGAQGHATDRSLVQFTADGTVTMDYFLASDHPDPHPA